LTIPPPSGVDHAVCVLENDPDGDNGGSVLAIIQTDNPCADPITYTQTLDGNRTATIFTVDVAGNGDESVIVSWIVDNTAPTFTVPADVRTNATSASATNTTSIIPEIVIPTDLADILDPNPFFDPLDSRLNSYPVGNTTLTWTGKDAAGNTFSQEQNVTVSRIQLLAVNNTSPRWDVDTVKLTLNVTGFYPSDEIKIAWDDGTIDTIAASTLAGIGIGNANDGLKFNATHIYAAGESGQTETIHANITSTNPGTVATSNTLQTTVQPHITSLALALPDDDLTDAADPSVLWGNEYGATFTLTDTEVGGALSATLDGLTLDYTASTANSTSVGATGLLGGDSTSSSEAATFVAKGIGNVGTLSVNGSFTATAQYVGSIIGANMDISRHHTQLQITFVQDVDNSTEAAAILGPAVPYDFNFTAAATLSDLNTTSAAISQNDLSGKLINYTGIALSATDQPFVFSTAGDTNSTSQSNEVTAVGIESTLGINAFLATFSPLDNDPDYITSSNANSTSITRHHTSSLITFINNVDNSTEAATSPAVQFDYNFTVKATLTDINATDAENLTGELTGKLFNYTGVALNTISQPFVFDVTGSASSATHGDQVTAVGIDGTTAPGQNFNATFSPLDNDIDYVTSKSVNNTEITRHHTKVDLISVDDVDMTDNSPTATISAPFNFNINATAKITDLNATDTAADTGDVSGLTFTYSNNVGSTAINTTDATVDFTTEGPSPQRIMASDESILTAAGHGFVADNQGFNVTFAGDANYITSFNATGMFNITQHHTRLNIDAIQDGDTTDVAVPSNPWDFAFTSTSNLIDLNFSAAAIQNNGDLSGKNINFSSSSGSIAINETNGVILFQTEGPSPLPSMASDVSTLTTAGPGNVGPQNFGVEFANHASNADANYIGSTNSTTDANLLANIGQFTISKHHTRTNILTILDVALYDASANSAPWDWNFTTTTKLIDLNFTASALQNGDVSGQTLTYFNDDTSAGNQAINTTDGITVVTTDGPGPIPAMDQTSDELTAAGPGNVGLQHFNVTYAGDVNFIASTNSTIDANVPDFTVAKHDTRLNIIDVQDRQLFDTDDPSVPWDFLYNSTVNLLDLNFTGSELQNGDLSGKLINYTNRDSSDGNRALNSTANNDFLTEGPAPLPSLASDISELVASEAGNEGFQDFDVEFGLVSIALDPDYIGSANSTDDPSVLMTVNITKHHTDIIITSQEPADGGSTINAVGLMVDLNKTGTTATVEGLDITMS